VGKRKAYLCLVLKGKTKGDYCIKESKVGAVVYNDHAEARQFAKEWPKLYGWPHPMGAEPFETTQTVQIGPDSELAKIMRGSVEPESKGALKTGEMDRDAETSHRS